MGAEISLTGIQVRAARTMLGMTQEQLAQLSLVSLPTIKDFEKDLRKPHVRTVRDLKRTLEEQGIVFLAPEDGSIGVLLTAEARARLAAAGGDAEAEEAGR